MAPRVKSQAYNDAVDVRNFPETQSQHVKRAYDALLLGAPVLGRIRAHNPAIFESTSPSRGPAANDKGYHHHLK
jgi:hypothetical protein